MSIDSTTQTELEKPVLQWRVLCYADFVGDVLRATSGIYEKVISGSGDSELDGTYDPYHPELIEIGEVRHQEQGADTVTISMNGLIVNNEDFLNLIGDKSKWQGRIARLWFYLVDENENQVGEIIPYYTGYMNDVNILGSPESQKVALTIENYLISLAGAQAKSYLSQSLFDSGDTSAAASIAAANGLVEGVVSGGGGGGGYRGSGADRQNQVLR